MNHIFSAALIFLIAAILLSAILIVKNISSAKKQNAKLDAAFLVATLEDARRISKEWNLGFLCFTEMPDQKNCFLLSFELGQDDLDTIETILHYEQYGGWEVIHPDYSALPIFAKELVINHQGSRENFYALMETTIAEAHPEWQFVKNNSVRIICF